jgi:hypothetical protein
VSEWPWWLQVPAGVAIGAGALALIRVVAYVLVCNRWPWDRGDLE